MIPDPEQPEARARVLACLLAAGETGISSHDLCVQANTHAAVRRVWELSIFYGFRILGAKAARNCWQWTLIRPEPWARDPNLTVREARTAEKSRLEALAREIQPISRQRTIWEVGA